MPTVSRIEMGPGVQCRVRGNPERLRIHFRNRCSMSQRFLAQARTRIEQLRADGFYKSERIIASQQSARVRLADGTEVLNFCANNYLGLANDARLIEAAREGLATDGFGMASVRFICGTQTGHKALEAELAHWLGM